jgi:hypothetical protein
MTKPWDGLALEIVVGVAAKVLQIAASRNTTYYRHGTAIGVETRRERALNGSRSYLSARMTIMQACTTAAIETRTHVECIWA